MIDSLLKTIADHPYGFYSIATGTALVLLTLTFLFDAYAIYKNNLEEYIDGGSKKAPPKNLGKDAGPAFFMILVAAVLWPLTLIAFAGYLVYLISRIPFALIERRVLRKRVDKAALLLTSDDGNIRHLAEKYFKQKSGIK